MLSLLIGLLLLAIVVYVVILVIQELPLPEPVRKVAFLIVGLVGLIWLLEQLGLYRLPLK